MKAISLFALVTLAATVVSGQQDAPSNPRRVQSTGRPIVEQINQEDKHIVLKKNAFAPMMVGPSPGTSFLNFMTDGCELVVMATVRSRTPKLDQRQAWIVTNVEAVVEKVLKAPAVLNLSEGKAIRFEEDGGSMMVAGTFVDAVAPWRRALTTNRRYLIFGAVLPEGQILVSPVGMYEQEGVNNLRRMSAGDLKVESDDIDGRIPEEVLPRIQARVSQRRPGQ